MTTPVELIWPAERAKAVSSPDLPSVARGVARRVAGVDPPQSSFRL